MNMLDNVKKYGMYMLLMGGAMVATSCDDDSPGKENEEEIITNVTLIFTNDADPLDVVTARAEDPDGEGVLELEVLDDIELTEGVTYTLTMEILNALETPPEDIGEEIEEEDDEHQFFFSFTNDVFADPLGNGNVDNASDDVNYNDFDDNTNPVGLSTTWTAGGPSSGGSFRVILKHQPGVKSDMSTVNDGDTDFDLDFVLDILD